MIRLAAASQNPVRLMTRSNIASVSKYSTHAPAAPRKVTMKTLNKKYEAKSLITMVTAYDYPSAHIVSNQTSIDMILVGDSLGMTMLGHESTVPVTIEDILHHCKAVSRGANRPFIIGDMPFGSYEVSTTEAVKNAVRIVKEGSAHAVKLEGGLEMVDKVSAISRAGIAVMGHIGLTPQTSNKLGGFLYQGKTAKEAQRLFEAAQALEEAGCFSVTLECVPAKVAAAITANISIPTIGIGAGNGTSGQVLVWHDMLGLYPRQPPKFSKQFANLSGDIARALGDFEREVGQRSFPALEHTCPISDTEYEVFLRALPKRDFTSTYASTSALKTTEAEKQAKTPTVTSIANKKKILVVGSGAMGSMLAARWALHGHAITLVGRWSEHLSAVQRDGLQLESAESLAPQRVRGISTVDIAVPSGIDQLRSSATQHKFDAIVVAVKSGDTARVAGTLPFSDLLAPNGVVLTIQNGLGNAETLAAALPSSMSVLQAVTSGGALTPAAGTVRVTGRGPSALAKIRGSPEALSCGAQLMAEAELPADTNADPEEVTWRKLLVNAAINPVTALLRVPNAEILSRPRAAEMLATEVWNVANAKNIHGFENGTLDAHLQEMRAVAKRTAANRSSMLRDVERGVATEVSAINGAVVREGKRAKVATPYNELVTELLSNSL